NLFLHITGRRPDGYHNLQTVFQLLDYSDELDFQPSGDGTINVSCNDSSILAGENLVFRAARLLQAYSNTAQGARIRLHKRLPIGGGLGGGSSDAATTLLGLNHLWELGLPTDELLQLGLQLGADVPVFIQGASAWAEGIGEILQPICLPQSWYLVLTPPCHVATSEIFSHQQLTRNTAPIKIPAFPISGCKNDCEQVACLLYPEIRQALDWLGQYRQATMTGTGASIFAGFDSKEQAERVLAQKPGHLQGFVAKGVNTSPLQQALTRAA
ncbi:MAG: 4-(cytidine 5'-diphospho)-2-C-methyl-D-erythritol kinase, partial [Pseudohongiellaceae bacterium]